MIQQLQILDIGTGHRLATCKESAAEDPQYTAEDGMRDIQLLVVLVKRGARFLARDQLPELVTSKILREREGVSRRVWCKTKPLAQLGEPYTADLLTKSELDVRSPLSIILELQRGEELKGETRVSSLGDGPEGRGYPNPTRET
jgi:hypothetical protein